jgi:hypothetical protein
MSHDASPAWSRLCVARVRVTVSQVHKLAERIWSVMGLGGGKKGQGSALDPPGPAAPDPH